MDLATGIEPGLVDPGQVMVHTLANIFDSKTFGTDNLLFYLGLGF